MHRNVTILHRSGYADQRLLNKMKTVAIPNPIRVKAAPTTGYRGHTKRKANKEVNNPKATPIGSLSE